MNTTEQITEATKLIHTRWSQAVDDGDLEVASRLLETAIKVNQGLIVLAAKPWLRKSTADRDDIFAVVNLAFVEAWRTWNPDKGSLWSWSYLQTRRHLIDHIRYEKGLTKTEIQERYHLLHLKKNLLPYDKERLHYLTSYRDADSLDDPYTYIHVHGGHDWSSFNRERNERRAVLWAFEAAARLCGSKAASSTLARFGLIDTRWRLKVTDTEVERHHWYKATKRAEAFLNHPVSLSKFQAIQSGEIISSRLPDVAEKVAQSPHLYNLTPGELRELREEITGQRV